MLWSRKLDPEAWRQDKENQIYRCGRQNGWHSNVSSWQRNRVSRGTGNRRPNPGHEDVKCPGESSWEEVLACSLQKQGDAVDSKVGEPESRELWPLLGARHWLSKAEWAGQTPVSPSLRAIPSHYSMIIISVSICPAVLRGLRQGSGSTLGH